jgi:VIT1/CCC1 family predicted Fe2+/Mn2+ transporter
MANGTESRPLSELLGGLVGDISGLFRKEIELAKAEASEKVSQTMNGVVFIAIGGVLALGALGVLLSAIVALLAAFFVSQGWDETMASAVAAFIVTVVVGIIAWIMISKGISNMKASNLNLNRTAASLGRDAEVVKERL